MKKCGLLALSLMLFSSGLSAQQAAKQWEAKCVDGKNLHYLQTINGNGYLYMTVTLPDKSSRVFPYARMRQTFFNGQAVCGEIVNGLRTRSNKPVSQFCINRNSKLIYMKFQDPLEQQPANSGQFCRATIIER